MKTRKLYVVVLGIIGLLACTPTISHAFIAILGSGSLGDYTGSLDNSFTNATTAELEIFLTNTSPAANGGYLTAFVLNNPLNRITGATLTPSDADFGLLGAGSFNNGINGAPYGTFDVGASTGGSFEGGGNPSKGIAVGNTVSFLFSLTGTNLDTLTEQSFLDTLSVPPGDGGGTQSFVARFRGFQDGGSDKVIGEGTDDNPVVPEPASLVLVGAGMVGALIGKRKKI
jgi:hypothetical protein